MKLAIACHPTFGGSGVVASELGMELARRGHEVHFVSYEPPVRVNPMHEGVFVHEVEVNYYPLFRYPPFGISLATKLMEVVKKHGVRLLHAHYAIPHSISAILARQMCRDCGIQVVTTLHGTDITLVGSDHAFYEVTRYAIEESQAVTAVSTFLAEATRTRFAVERAIHVVPNFIDPDFYTPAKRRASVRRRFARDDERLLIHVSNFRPVKRTLDVVGIFDAVQKELPARLLLVGTGPDAPAVEEELGRRKLLDRTTQAGALVDVSEAIACADLLLLPSDAESFGLAALEALACGVPVVGTRAGGLPEVVDDGVTGILEPVGDVAAMARRTIALLQDPLRLAETARAARAAAIERFPTERIVSQYEDLYRRVEQGCRM